MYEIVWFPVLLFILLDVSNTTITLAFCAFFIASPVTSNDNLWVPSPFGFIDLWWAGSPSALTFTALNILSPTILTIINSKADTINVKPIFLFFSVNLFI